jgi:hypothetical protein
MEITAEPSQVASAVRRQQFVLAGIAAATIAFSVRLFRFIDEHAVDVLFSDQWALWDGLFQKADLWTLWRWQWGPQRQGLGALVTAATAWLSGWNLRAEAFVCGAIVVLACVAALALVRAARGRWVVTDGVVPLVVLTLSQYENLVVTTNPSHGPLPLLLALLFALALWIQRPRLRLAVLVGLHFVIAQTGFTWLLGVIAPVLFGLLLWDAVRRRTDVALHAGALVASLASLALFFLRAPVRVICRVLPIPRSATIEVSHSGSAPVRGAIATS